MNINNLNSLFYSKVDEVFKSSGLADFFIKIDPIQTALAKKIENLIPKKLIRVKELGSGADLTRWKIISKLRLKSKWQVILTDFSDKSIPNEKTLSVSENFHFSSQKSNLINPFPLLKEKDRYDAILATYVFDSIWFPQDAHYKKLGNDWHKTTYNLEVDQSYPKRKLLLKALKSASSIESMQMEQFSHIFIKKRQDTVDINMVPYGGIISTYYQNKSNVSLNFPGGLINVVQEFFENQISHGGVFIIGDMAVNTKKEFMADYLTSGKVAKFKVEDYGLAAFILKQNGFDVELVTVEDFISVACNSIIYNAVINNSGYEIPLKVRDHWIMIVKKRG